MLSWTFKNHFQDSIRLYNSPPARVFRRQRGEDAARQSAPWGWVFLFLLGQPVYAHRRLRGRRYRGSLLGCSNHKGLRFADKHSTRCFSMCSYIDFGVLSFSPLLTLPQASLPPSPALSNWQKLTRDDGWLRSSNCHWERGASIATR